ncbi:hypothetical protein BGX28_005485 [Mortierella sp. GBA30]|nr:hypothetical protein BGX28_005485 [Mortierella sp. GBA30]
MAAQNKQISSETGGNLANLKQGKFNRNLPANTIAKVKINDVERYTSSFYSSLRPPTVGGIFTEGLEKFDLQFYIPGDLLIVNTNLEIAVNVFAPDEEGSLADRVLCVMGDPMIQAA